MKYRLTAENEKKVISEVYFSESAAEIARKVYEAYGYTVKVEVIQ